MITFKIRFSFYDPCNRFALSYKELEFTVKSEDEKKGLIKGLSSGIGVLSDGFQVEILT